MGLSELIVLLLIVGVVLYFFPIDAVIKNIILCIIVIAVILAVVHGPGGFSGHRYWNW